MTARKPFTFTSTPAARTSPETLRGRGYKLGDTVWTSDVNTDGSLHPDGDREVYVFADDVATSSGVYVLASTLSPRAALKVGDRVKVAASAKTAAAGRVYYGDAEQLAEVTYVSGRNAEVRPVAGAYAGKTQTVGLTYLTKTADDELKVGDRVEYIGTDTARHIGKAGVVTRVPRNLSDRYATVYWTADGDSTPGDRGAYVRNLRKITTLAPAAEPTHAERFPVGRLVVTTADPKTADGGYVSPEFRGAVAVVKATDVYGGREVRLALPGRPTLTNIVAPEHLTLLPEGVELVKPTVREPLSFTDAYAKAVAHRGEPTSAKQVAKASKLAELLIEVSK